MQTIKVAAASIRNRLGQPEAALADMHKWVETARDKGAELVLFPELNLSGYAPAPVAAKLAEPVPGPSTGQVICMAERFGVTIAFGLIEQAGGACYCTHVLVNGSGVIGKQSKIHVPAHEQPFWRAGGSIEVFDISKAKVGITLCRDSFFDEMTRTLYFMGAEIILMPFGYHNVPRSRYLKETIHGMSLVKSAWANGFYEVVCNSAEGREPNEWEPEGRSFPGWAGVISPWGRVMSFVQDEGSGEALVVEELTPQELEDRRSHPNFLAKELRPELYRFR